MVFKQLDKMSLTTFNASKSGTHFRKNCSWYMTKSSIVGQDIRFVGQQNETWCSQTHGNWPSVLLSRSPLPFQTRDSRLPLISHEVLYSGTSCPLRPNWWIWLKVSISKTRFGNCLLIQNVGTCERIRIQRFWTKHQTKCFKIELPTARWPAPW